MFSYQLAQTCFLRFLRPTFCRQYENRKTLVVTVKVKSTTQVRGGI